MQINQAQAVQNYVEAVVEQGDYTPPDANTLRYMSTLLDTSAKKAFDVSQGILLGEKPIKRAVRKLRKAAPTCGRMTPDKAILSNLTPHEQMTAVSTFVRKMGPNIQKPRTLVLGEKNNEVLPVWVKKPKNGPATLMTVVLGNTRGDLKAPRYHEWAKNDPHDTPGEVFIDSLNSLEIQRQPDCIGGLLLKANAYDNQLIPNDWRYNVYTKDKEFAREASVELPKQSSNKTRDIKQQSAAYNLAKMVGTKTLRRENILPVLHYEDYRDGYDDDAIPTVTPISLVKALGKKVRGKSEPLDTAMSRLFVTRLGMSDIPAVREYVAEELFPSNEK